MTGNALSHAFGSAGAHIHGLKNISVSDGRGEVNRSLDRFSPIEVQMEAGRNGALTADAGH